LPKLKKDGYLTGNKDFALPYSKEDPWQFLIPAYEWMQKQMKKRIKGYTGELPMWAYIECPPHNLKAKPRYGDKPILIKAEIPLSRCLLSDFTMWECVMNNWHLADTLKECKADLEDKIKIPKRKRIKNWEKIFIMTPPKPKERAVMEYMHGDDIFKGKYIQVCIDRIYKDEIIYIKKKY